MFLTNEGTLQHFGDEDNGWYGCWNSDWNTNEIKRNTKQMYEKMLVFLKCNILDTFVTVRFSRSHSGQKSLPADISNRLLHKYANSLFYVRVYFANVCSCLCSTGKTCDLIKIGFDAIRLFVSNGTATGTRRQRAGFNFLAQFASKLSSHCINKTKSAL